MKKYWKDIESKKVSENEQNPGIESETEKSSSDLFHDLNKDLPASRRDFLKLCGFSFAVSALGACQSKIGKAIPYIIAPVELTPGEALYYASSYINGNDYCSIIVKTRDGRPIKIEGNPASSINKGGTNARVQATVLDLYDTSRFHGPVKDDVAIKWEDADKEIVSSFQKIKEEKGTIVFLTPTIFSPSTEAVISGFLKKFPGSEWVMYDAISYSGILEANKECFGKQVIPDYRFDKADVIVSLGADFLGSWLSPIEYTKQYSSRRDPESNMNWLVQLESNLSLTGSNADKRIQVKPSHETAILLNIYKEIIKVTENREIVVPDSPVSVKEITQKLLSARGKSLVLSGSNIKQVQVLVNEINSQLGNIGKTILFNSYLRTHSALDESIEKLTGKMKRGEVSALLTWNVNPAYTWYKKDEFLEGIKKVGLTISFSSAPDETTSLCKYILPDNHYLESWNDAEPRKNFFSLMQPAISPIFDTRQMTDSLLKWSGNDRNYYDFIKAFWATNHMPHQAEYGNPDSFFDHVLQTGVFEPALQPMIGETESMKQPIQLGQSLLLKPWEGKNKFEIVLYENIAIGEGRQANNPWLQELPDPITRICWDNYASISPAQAKENDLNDNDVIKLGELELPVHIQPGQAYGTIGIALGYGRTVCGKVGQDVGANVWNLTSSQNGNVMYTAQIDGVVKTGKIYPFAQTQTHHSMEGRAFVREAELKEFRDNPSAGNELFAYNSEHNKSLYKDRVYPHHHWGMAIDLSKCTGCANCVIACQAENNVPVVGKTEVYRVHEMQWIRIDRYYTGEEDNPEVVFQPVLCQHCQNAPCENVCPVAATNHSSEGLNQMIYNRCFGTRYCNNNCPYKVRRFNWFNFTGSGTLAGNLRDKEGMTGDLRRMVLNPDVTIRPQGVIEKCSFCVQRIQAVKLKAKAENRAILENEIQTACSQSCPADAIIFGDMNDRESELFRLISSGRRYNLLEELYTMPSVNYLTKIKNKIL